MNNKDRVLFVDDEANLLDSYRRSLRKIVTVETALSGQEALEMMKNSEPFSIVVSDMQMPGMNGIEFLAEAKKRSPDTVRMMLTGNADQLTAIEAVNKGDVFRFLNKPCEPKEMAMALFAAAKQYRLITAEKEVLEKTLAGTIGVLNDVLSMVNPDAFGKTTRIKRLVRAVAEQLQLDNLWQYETMAGLSQIGCVILPEELLSKHAQGVELNEEEKQIFDQQASTGAHLISKIPRLEDIAHSIQYQGKNYDGSGIPNDNVSGEDVPMGSRILKIVSDYDIYQSRELTSDQCLSRLEANKSWYDPVVLNAFRAVFGIEAKAESASFRIKELQESMVFAEDVYTNTGLLVVGNGQEASLMIIERLVMFARSNRIADSVLVYNFEPKK